MDENAPRSGQTPAENQRTRRPLGAGKTTRRTFLAGTGTGTAVAFTAARAHARPTPPVDPRLLQGKRPILLRGGTVITMDKRRRVLDKGDVLVRAGRIRALGRHVDAPTDAVVLDMTDRIVMPGMIDTHRHMWQSSLRSVTADWTISNYVDWMFGVLGPLYTADDIHAGSLLGAIEAIDSGVTTVVDWSHNLRTRDHGDAVLDALIESGIRARLAIGLYDAAPAQWVRSGDIEHLRRRFPTTKDLVTLQLAIDVLSGDPTFPERPAFEYARQHGLAVTTHAGNWGVNPDIPPKFLRDAGLLDSSTSYVHAAVMSDESYKIIADSGGSVSVSSESELHAGQGYPATNKLREFGIQTTLSVDTVTWFSGDMFNAMRSTLGADRALEHMKARETDSTVRGHALRAHDVLGYATIDAAKSLGMGDEIGSLVPGTAADIVILDATTPSMLPHTNPVGSVVLQAGRGEVESVMIGGRMVKHQGQLVDADLAHARRLGEKSRDRLFRKAGPKLVRAFLDPPKG